jgi:hypothetical protein
VCRNALRPSIITSTDNVPRAYRKNIRGKMIADLKYDSIARPPDDKTMSHKTSESSEKTLN